MPDRRAFLRRLQNRSGRVLRRGSEEPAHHQRDADTEDRDNGSHDRGIFRDDRVSHVLQQFGITGLAAARSRSRRHVCPSILAERFPRGSAPVAIYPASIARRPARRRTKKGGGVARPLASLATPAWSQSQGKTRALIFRYITTLSASCAWIAKVPLESFRPAIFAGGVGGVGSVKSTICFPFTKV